MELDHAPAMRSTGNEMSRRVAEFDWARTPLGPSAQWPQNLRSALSLCLSSRFPILLFWGSEFRMLYNDAYVPFLGQAKHPEALGSPADICWREIWGRIGPMLEGVTRSGEATWSDDEQFFFDRALPREEVYVTFTYGPIFSEDERRVDGIFVPCTETTEKIVSARRLDTLRQLGARSGETRELDDACRRIAAALSENRFDVSFAALYRAEAEPGGEGEPRFSLLASMGLEAAALEPSAWPLASVQASGQPLVLELPEEGAVLPGGAWPEPSTLARVVPLRWSGDGRVDGAVVLGVSPRRPLDAAYLSFQELVAGNIETAIANALAYQQERRRAEALIELDRGKTAFFSNISHEFRTPLTLLLGPLEEACANPQVPEGVRAQLGIAHGNSRRLLRLVNALLDFAQIEAGRLRASFRSTDLAALTRDIASPFRSMIERAGLRLAVECEALGEPVHVDAELWEKVLSNLLSNAFKFTLQGAIEVRLRREGRHAVCEVADTGIGVAADALPRLFERFYRVAGNAGRSMEGTGIGLALARELVGLHGGTIEAASEVGRGTTFTIRLPFGTAHLPAESLAAEPARPARPLVEEALPWLPSGGGAAAPGRAEPGGDRRFASTFGARIVVADDNADMRDYLLALLGGAYRVEAVDDGRLALAAARREPPDLVLTDVMMPNLDGFALREALRAEAATREVPVIMLSARAGEQARIEAIDAGVDDYLVKPFSARELLARIGAVLERDAELRERRAVQERLRRRTAQIETLLDVAPIGVLLIDADGRFVEVNPAARRALGLRRDLLGRDFREVTRLIWRRAYADEIIGIFQRTLETGERFFTPERVETRLDTGRTEFYEWQVDRIGLPDGRHGLVCYFRDVSAQVQARQRMQHADRQKDEFLAMLAHELRNPLAPVRHCVELLAASPEDARVPGRVTPILMRQTGILGRLVEDLLEVSRITRGLVTLRREPVRLDSIVEQAVEAARPLFEARGHALAVHGDPALTVLGDPTRLVQCVLNLLNNAAKYTEPGGAIRVESVRREARAVIGVTDNGRGIPAELLPHVFNLFVQGERTPDRRDGGLGIGLSIVAELVARHGGSVAADSAGPGLGARFEIALPLHAAEPGVVSGDAPVPALDGANALDDAPHAPHARRVLVVDDNQDAANALAALLETDGHQVTVAYSAPEALALAESLRPDAVLLDIGLPGMDGHEVARRMRASPRLRRAQLIAVTGYGQASDRENSMSAGFDAHLVKPVAVPLLQRMLRQAGARR
ncbi:ATP-binding protein [Burkholderia gladioli]|uniref:ATP-binding protein n=1 Tax=Burkholderia gladioli TaxID=28095 RepID=UPI00244651BF|nr:ATP-binding protein [Burkholderia gladioli]